MAAPISSSLAMPVEIMTGFPELATRLINGRSTASKEAILNAGAPRLSSKSTAVLSKGELN
jgi:hypothetical protein